MIEPQGYVVHYGCRYRIVAQFEDTATGIRLANALMMQQSFASVLCVREGWIFLARSDDMGEPLQ